MRVIHRTYISVDKNGDMCKGQVFLKVPDIKVAQKTLFYNVFNKYVSRETVTHETELQSHKGSDPKLGV